MSPDAAATTFPEADFRVHRQSGKRDRGDSGAVWRATGDVYIPRDLNGHIEFISGLTELWTGRAQRQSWSSKSERSGNAGGSGGTGRMEVRLLEWRDDLVTAPRWVLVRFRLRWRGVDRQRGRQACQYRFFPLWPLTRSIRIVTSVVPYFDEVADVLMVARR